jgi:hypothetical protein
VSARPALAAALAAATVLLQPAARADDVPAKAPVAPVAPAAAPEQDAGPAPRGAPDADARRAGARRMEGPMPPEMVERVMAVARDVSPELAAQLERSRQESPESVSQAMRQNARRLMALAVVKERNPAVRVEDLRLQIELRKLGEEYRAAVAAGDAGKASALESQIAAKARTQVDIDLKARAQELVALDDQMKSMREELAAEQKRTDERVAERIDAVKQGKPLQERPMLGEGGLRRQRPGADAPEAGAPADAPRKAPPKADA